MSTLSTSALSAIGKAEDAIKSNIGIIGATAGGLAVGGIVGYAASRSVSSRSRKKKKAKAYSRSRRKRSHAHRRGRQRKPYTARKHRDTSHRRIRYTKNNQPYIITASGKARFIKKSSVKNSRRRAGGRY